MSTETANTTPNVKRFIIPLLLAGMMITATVGSISSAGQPQFPNPCLTQNRFCSTISFDQSIVLNTTAATVSTLTSTPFLITQNETMLIATHSSLGGANVTAITDTMGDTFTKIVRTGTTFSEGWMDAWIGTAGTTGSDVVTVNWNALDVSFAEISIYRNVGGFGNFTANTQQSSGVTSLSASLITVKSGSWVAGMSGTNQAGAVGFICQALSPSSNFIQRVNSCSGMPATAQNSMFMSDNATSLRNQSTISLTSTTSNGATISIDMIEVELTPSDLEPQNPLNICIKNTAACGFCNQSGSFGYCVNSVSKAAFANTVQNLVVGTSYCTGVSITTGVTIGSGAVLQAIGIYAVQDENVTGAIMWVQLVITNNVPSTSFAAGQCAAAGNGGTGNAKFQFDSNNMVLTQHALAEYYTTVSALAPTPTAGTYYAYFELTPQSVSVKIAQWGADCQISIIEIK